MKFHLGLSGSLSLSSHATVAHVIVQGEQEEKESLLAVEADTSEDGTHVHPSLSGWPWESTNSWEPPFFVLSSLSELVSEFLRISIKQCWVDSKKKADSIIIWIVAGDVILVICCIL